MKKKLRKASVILILTPIIGNVYSLTKIQNLEKEIKNLESVLEKERNPTFEQAKGSFSAEICFSDWKLFETSSHSDWVYYKGCPEINFWPTWEEAIEHYTEFSTTSGDLHINIHKAVNDTPYMGIWDENTHSPMNAHLSLLGGNLMELNATLMESRLYIVGVNYKGVNLFSALEVTLKK